MKLLTNKRFAVKLFDLHFDKFGCYYTNQYVQIDEAVYTIIANSCGLHRNSIRKHSFAYDIAQSLNGNVESAWGY